MRSVCSVIQKLCLSTHLRAEDVNQGLDFMQRSTLTQAVQDNPKEFRKLVDQVMPTLDPVKTPVLWSRALWAYAKSQPLGFIKQNPRVSLNEL
jgi:hypothetical protein